MTTVERLIRRILAAVIPRRDEESANGLDAAALRDLRAWIATFDDSEDRIRSLGVRPAMSVAWTMDGARPVVTHAHLTGDRRNIDGRNADDLARATRILATLRPTGPGYVLVRGTVHEPSNREMLAHERDRRNIEAARGIA